MSSAESIRRGHGLGESRGEGRRTNEEEFDMNEKTMTVDAALRAIAGSFVLLSVALGVWVNPWFFAFTAFVGANLLQSGFSGWCPMMWVLKKAGLRSR
jgi:hypothetical protein